jgi:hypothetical protein
MRSIRGGAMTRSIYDELERDMMEARQASVRAERRQRDLLTECEHATIRLTFAFMRLQRLVDIKYRPDQPRVPIGQPGGGRWAGGDAGDSRSTTDEGPKAHARERNTAWGCSLPSCPIQEDEAASTSSVSAGWLFPDQGTFPVQENSRLRP